MRVGLFHNHYIYRGGEDVAFELEAELLAKAGHEVHALAVDNRDEIGASSLGALRAGLRARWNPDTLRRVDAFLAAHPIDVAHVHNFFPVFSPALHTRLHARGIPVVQTLHNYRLLCANGLMLRGGRSCEDCVALGPWNAVRHACYRGSRLQTLVWSEMTALHRRRRTWHACVDLFTTPSDFARRVLLATGIPPGRFRVVPLPVPDPGPACPPGEGALFVGRLSPEKGVDLLIEAWRQLDGYPLRIVGAGPEEERLRARAADVPGVCWVGGVPHDRVLAAMRAAAFVVVPSRWYENFPLSLIEAKACARAAVVAHPTALSDLVAADDTGLRFEMGDVQSLAEACRALAFDPERTRRLGERARAQYEACYAPERCVELLEEALRSVTR
ncbi:MAG: glycosyltransferase family 4 protein [Myxococcales bacterium]|nr:glycosyltransferase family 4 protein [Myxococcales bacterium]MDH5307105.1 glycosyltransferase family 4 protein [Myxococcales bacterium]MDH5565036.1 glycosyltransferase family 4 protein [Myxococcales bacterium]